MNDMNFAGHGRAHRVQEDFGIDGKFGKFGIMFGLPPLGIPSADLGKLDELAAVLLDDGTTSADNANIEAGYTYLGQFIDHDITLDRAALGESDEDPEAVSNFRTPRLDLDCVYAGGPTKDPALYDRADPRKLKIGIAGAGAAGDPGIRAGLLHDLPRDAQGVATIGDARNDENLLVAQTHLAFLKFHNAVVDHVARDNPALSPAQTFQQARRVVVQHYQSIVLHDYVAKLVDFTEVADVITNGRRFYRFEQQSRFAEPYMPFEFSAAAYRLGHSMVREDYNHNRAFRPGAIPATLELLFLFTGLSGGIVGAQGPASGPTFPSLPGDWAIDWHRFYRLGAPGTPPPQARPQADGFGVNQARLFDPFIVRPLHALPKGGGNLAGLNMRRGVMRRLPSGQAVAAAMRNAGLTLTEITEAQLTSGADGRKLRELGLHRATPLWYYILKEAQQLGNGGNRLGTVGGRILAEVFVGLLQGDRDSVLNTAGWKPSLPAANGRHFTMPDLLRFVDRTTPGFLDPINEPSSF